MDLLLDTHVLIWWMRGSSGRLGPRAYELIGATDTRTLISAASVWEIAIKSSRGRLQLEPPEEWIPDVLAKGFEPVPITFQHASAVRTLPHHHGDPFDRMLIAQAICENLTIVTADAVIRAYDVPTLDASI